VAAIVGALSAALGRMAANYTVGKPASAQHEARLRELLDELRHAGEMFIELSAGDMAAYQAYSTARRGGGKDVQQRALLTAAAVPLEMVAVASALLERLSELEPRTNPDLLSGGQKEV
jgi:formiminotetrahydrofolate cyclodeaminase